MVQGTEVWLGVEGFDARPLFVVVMVVSWRPCIASPFVSVSSRFMRVSFRLPPTMPPTISGSSLSTSSSWCSFEVVPVSFDIAFTSGMLLPVAIAAESRSGVEVPLGFDTEFCLAGSAATDWVEFCLARDEAGLPFAGRGDTRPEVFVSGNVLRIGEEAIDGDIAFDVIVLFLVGRSLANIPNEFGSYSYLLLPFCPFVGRTARDLFFNPSGPGVSLGLPPLPFVAAPLLPNTLLRARSHYRTSGRSFIDLSTFRRVAIRACTVCDPKSNTQGCISCFTNLAISMRLFVRVSVSIMVVKV